MNKKTKMCVSDLRCRVREIQKGEGPETDQRDRQWAPIRCPMTTPKQAQQGPDSDHQTQGTKTARPGQPKPGQEDDRWKRDGLYEEDCDIGEARTVYAKMLCIPRLVLMQEKQINEEMRGNRQARLNHLAGTKQQDERWQLRPVMNSESIAERETCVCC